MRKRFIIWMLLSVLLSIPARAQFRVEGPDKPDLEQAFLDGLLQFTPSERWHVPDSLVRVGRNLYLCDQGYFETESVRNRAYFKRDLVYRPVCEAGLAAESVTTLLTGYTGQTRFTVHLVQHLYSYAIAEVTIPLAQLVQYCLSEGCVPYVGVEKVESHLLTGVLFMVHPKMGYCHTIKFTINPVLLDVGEGVLEAEAFTHTPIHNLRR